MSAALGLFVHNFLEKHDLVDSEDGLFLLLSEVEVDHTGVVGNLTLQESYVSLFIVHRVQTKDLRTHEGLSVCQQ